MTSQRVSYEHILIVGCGYTGEALVRLVRANGTHVTATRRVASLCEGADVVAVDVTQTVDWDSLLDGVDAVVWSVPTLPKLDDHLAPLRRMCVAAQSRDLAVVYISSTSVFGNHAGQPVEDDSPCHPDSPAGIMRLESERIVLGMPRGIVVRPAGIYGPGRDLASSIVAGRYEVVDPHKLTNRVHVDDLARSIVFVLEHEAFGRAFNVADGKPTEVGDVVDFLVTTYGIPRPATASLDEFRARRGEDAAARWVNQHVVIPRRLLDAGFTFHHPDIYTAYRSGAIR